MPSDRLPDPPDDDGPYAWRRYFRHYLTGVVYDAWDYGHKAWPIPKRRKP